jgi:alkylation response protein AidB-like acyl-CoA dehydrogenase
MATPTALPTPIAPADLDAVLARADRVADLLRPDAAARDRANVTPRAEVELLRQHDLLQVQEPVELGGEGLTIGQAGRVVRRVARADTGVAHLLGYHYAQTRIVHLFGTPDQIAVQAEENARERLFWGGVQNPRGGSDLVLTRDGGGFRLNGRRTFASGASIGERLSVTATLDGALVFLAIPGGKEGFHADEEWDAIGQRLTDSGGATFTDVRIEPSEVVGWDGQGTFAPDPEAAPTPFQTLVTPHWQLAFVNFYIGTAEGAIEDALAWTRTNASPWETSGVDRATDDAYILETVGELVAATRGAALLADRAGDALDAALAVGPALTPEERAEAAVAIYEAKVQTTKVSLDVTSRLFEIQGARATSTARGFDRYWRNVRTHTVHDPVAYKAREVGDWALNRRGPEFSLYR